MNDFTPPLNLTAACVHFTFHVNAALNMSHCEGSMLFDTI